MFQAKITLGLSDCIEVNGEPLEDPNQGEMVSFTVDLVDGPWVQFTYEELRDQDGSKELGVAMRQDGFWGYNDLRWSDLTISIEEVVEVPTLTEGQLYVAIGQEKDPETFLTLIDQYIPMIDRADQDLAQKIGAEIFDRLDALRPDVADSEPLRAHLLSTLTTLLKTVFHMTDEDLVKAERLLNGTVN